MRIFCGAQLTTRPNLAINREPLIVTNPKDWYTSEWIELLDRGLNIFLHMKPLNLWATDEGVRGMVWGQT